MIKQVKDQLRQSYRKHRKGHHESIDQERVTQKLREHFAVLNIPTHKLIGGFMPKGSEINIRPFLEELISQGYEICLPVVEENNPLLVFRPWLPGVPLLEDAAQILAPLAREGEGVSSVEPDVVLTPLLVFDEQGHRMGQGKGYYDRTLKALCQVKKILVIGVAYEHQKISLVPTDPNDYRMDIIVTEEHVYYC